MNGRNRMCTEMIRKTNMCSGSSSNQLSLDNKTIEREGEREERLYVQVWLGVVGNVYRYRSWKDIHKVPKAT